jgi:hypothetical protein
MKLLLVLLTCVLAGSYVMRPATVQKQLIALEHAFVANAHVQQVARETSPQRIGSTQHEAIDTGRHELISLLSSSARVSMAGDMRNCLAYSIGILQTIWG